MIDITPIVQAVITLAAAFITAFLVPWIHAHTTRAQQDVMTKILDVLVQAAEKRYAQQGSGSQRLQYVRDWLAARGYKIDEAAIEAAVLRLHAQGMDSASVFPAKQEPESADAEESAASVNPTAEDADGKS
jgi:hypothetical protein